MTSRGNKGTERDIKGVGWDMSIPLKLFLVLDGNGNMFPETSARSSNCEFSIKSIVTASTLTTMEIGEIVPQCGTFSTMDKVYM